MILEKYHGLGNDFLITQDVNIIGNKKLIIKLCNRYTGIGADGLIVVKQNPLEMVFYNQDGTRGEMCGNGIRCFSYYCYLHNIVNGNQFDVHTLDGFKQINIINTSPFISCVLMNKCDYKITNLNIEFNNKNYLVYAINFGVPHAVIYTEEITEEFGKYISNHSFFENKTNVNFVKIIDNETIKIKTYERGVGFTKACGTGSCASFVVSKYLGYVLNKAKVVQEEGSLDVYENNHNIYMQGPACKIAEIIFNE